MPKQDKLKDQFTLRIYNQEDKDVLDKAYERNKSGFDSISDFIRYCTITGAEKLLGDNEIDQRLNLTEIKQHLTTIKNDLRTFNSEREQDHIDNQVDRLIIQKLANFIANAVYKISHGNKVRDDVDDGLFYLKDVTRDCIEEVYDRK